VTAAWLRLIPAPELELPVVGVYPALEAGLEAIEQLFACGTVPAAIEYLDAAALGIAGAAYPFGLAPGAQFMVLTEADGDAAETRRAAGELADALAVGALAVHRPESRDDVAALWRWRGGVSFAVRAERGGAFSEDVAVPVDRL